MDNDADKNSTRSSFVEGVARDVHQACTNVDPDAKITYVGCDDEGRTIVRLRGGMSSSVVTLQRALSKLMPFAKVRTSEDVLDGSVQACIVVPTARDEWECASRQVRLQFLPRVLNGLMVVCACLGAGIWLSIFADTRPLLVDPV